MAVNLAPVGNDAPFLDSSGNPLSGGLMYWYAAGSTTPTNTYTTSAGNVANANPVVLDSGGYPAASGAVVEIWLTAGVNYKAVLKTAALVTVWTRDNLVGINDVTNAASEWTAGPAPTYIGATQFSLVGDQTSTFQVGRRVKTTNTGGTIYSTITASAFAAVTTVTVVNDSGTLDSGLSAVSYGLLSSTNRSIPGRKRSATTLVSGSGTYTVPAGCVSLVVRGIGAGGGGGGSSSGANNDGGTGGTGGATSFGTAYLSTTGGAGGVGGSTMTGGAGGGASGAAVLNIIGGIGNGGGISGAAGTASQGGNGGASAFGGNGSGGAATLAGVAGQTNTGGGGGGGGGIGAGRSGGGGGAGGYFEELITAPLATYAYAVGAAGTAGAAGTGGVVGGAGGSGVILIYEFYL